MDQTGIVKMGETIRASVGDIENIRKEIENCFVQLQKEQADLLESIKALGQMWEGPAHDRVQQNLEQEMAKLENLRQSGQVLFDFEKKAVQEFSSAEAQINDKINAI